MTNSVKVPQMAWYQPHELELTMPDGWQVETCNIAGYDLPALTDEQIKHAVTNLMGSPPIRELAKGKKEVVIIFDDIHRVTRVSRIIPPILEELAAAGIPDNKIRFIAANGTHAAMTREEFAKKLGESVISRFLCYNHNPFYNCTYLGTTSSGTKVAVNTEVVKCDFRITIGSVTPHLFVVLSGGSKMIVPGISSIETIVHNHKIQGTPEQRKNYETHPIHLDMDEVAGFVDIDVNIEGLINLWGDTVALYAGESKQSHDAAIQAAKSHYLTKRAKDKDIVIINNYIKPTEAGTAFNAAFNSLKESGGDVVLICNAPTGQVVHYVCGVWGNFVEAHCPVQFQLPPFVNRFIIYTQYPDYTGFSFIKDQDKIITLSKWDDVLRVLQETHGDKAEVAVYPNAEIPYFR